MEKVIVTGANGFIGRNFIKFLANKNIKVYAVDLSHENSILKGIEGINFIECDMREIKELANKVEDREFDAFYHFAWAGTTGNQRADYTIQSNNAIYTCDAAIISKEMRCKKFITTGTITEKVAEGILTNHYTSENLIYGLSKYYTHNLLDVLCHKEGINYVWAKLSNIFGGDNTNGNLISYTMKEFSEGRIPSYGPCLQPYNFTYIDDVISALYLLGKKENIEGEYLISNGECKTLNDYLITLANIYGKEVAIGTKSDDGVRYNKEWFDNDKLLKIGYEPQYTFKNAIKKIKGEQ